MAPPCECDDSVIMHSGDVTLCLITLTTYCCMLLDFSLASENKLSCCVFAGFVQFIESVAVAEILAAEGSILTYFRRLAPNDNTAFGIAPEMMDNYIKSCGV